MDGTCIDLFNGCDNVLDDFLFPTSTSARSASQALADQVFLDSPLGLFDGDPSLTRGCRPSSSSCKVITPYDLTPFVTVPGNDVTFDSFDNATGGIFTPDGFSFANNSDDGGIGPADGPERDRHTWAVWTQQPNTPIPEPGTILLLSTGLLGLAGYRWNQRRRAGTQVG